MTTAPGPAIDPARVREAMTGPITAIHPTFQRDGTLDWNGVRAGVEHGLAAGSGTMLLTYGDSLHSLITDERSPTSCASSSNRPAVARWSSLPIDSGGPAARSSSRVMRRVSARTS